MKRIGIVGLIIYCVPALLHGCHTIGTKTETKISNPQTSAMESKRVTFDPFEYVMGVPETQFVKADPKKFLQKSGTQIVLRNSKTNTDFYPGTFEIRTIKEWREKAPQTSTPSRFSVIEAEKAPWGEWYRDKFDVGSLQAAFENQGAVFQVASNFNGLEGGGSPAIGIMVYLSPDLYVQGEAASISAMPGTIWRMYYAPHQIHGKWYYGQLEQQINLLENFAPGSNLPIINVHNGYISAIPKPATFNNLSDQQRQAYIDAIKIGLHKDIQVTGGLGPVKLELQTIGYTAVPVNNPQQRINQVFTATINLNKSPFSSNPNQYEGAARLILQAAYQGTLYSALQTSKKKVFLTLVGGGVFGNKLSWIIDAIEQAVTSIGGLDVTLIIFEKSKTASAQELAYAEKTLLNRVMCSGGTYMRYKKDGVYQVAQQVQGQPGFSSGQQSMPSIDAKLRDISTSIQELAEAISGEKSMCIMC